MAKQADYDAEKRERVWVGKGTMHEGDLVEGKFADTYRPFVPKCGFG